MSLSRETQLILKSPLAFGARTFKAFRANQGLLLAGAVAYYALLSIVPLLILIVIALSHVIDQAELLHTLGRYLAWLLPGQSGLIVGELENFLVHRNVIGWFLLVTMIFFSSLAFTVLENAMSVIFFHRVAIRRRRFLVSAVLPYLYILFRSTAAGETGHALGHIDYLEFDPATGLATGTTRKNLQSVIEAETGEYESLYPEMARVAREEGFEEIANWFEVLGKAERSHARRFQQALDDLID